MAQEDTPQDSGSRPAQRMPSDKCDFAAVSGSPVRAGSAELSIGPAGQRMRMDSDKCDWRVLTPAVQVRGPSAAVTDDLQAHFPSGRLRMDSDKCDWRVRFDDNQQRDFRVATSGADWSVRMTGAWPGMSTPPRLRAEMESDKCDFAIRVEVGMQGGPTYRLRGVGSDKCDFRIVEAPREFLTGDGEEQQPC
jgi:hypothetical protein